MPPFKTYFALQAALTLTLMIQPANCEEACTTKTPSTKGNAEYKAGIDAYAKKDFKAAETHFRKSIEQGNKTPGAWLYAAHTFLALGQYAQAKQTYEMVTTMFKKSPEADIAAKGLDSINEKLAAAGTAPKKDDLKNVAAEKPKAAGEKDAGPNLGERISIVPPKMGHPAVSATSIKAVRDALNSIPAHLRQKLIDANAKINISPNMIDKWPDSVNDLDEEKEDLNLAELPGRIYGSDMYIYERAKSRGSLTLKAPRSATEMKHTAFNECFQVLDDQMKITKDPKLLVVYKAEVAGIPENYHGELANFMKDDDWGPRETCAELTAGMLGAAGEKDSDLNRYFPRTKKWLKAKLGL